MFHINFKINVGKEINKEIEKEILGLINELQGKFEKLKRNFSYKSKKEKKSLEINLDSKSYTATDFLVQFEKQVKQIIGKKFKTAIKLEIVDYEIETELETKAKKQFKIPFVKNLELKDKTATLIYNKTLSFENIKDHYVEKSLKLIEEKIKNQSYEGKDEFRETIWEGKQRKVVYEGDPAVDLEKKDWIRRTEAKGQFIYGREFTALVNVIKKLQIEHIYKKLSFFEMIFPKFEPWAVPTKSGHAKNVYPNAYFVCSPKDSSPESWEDVMDEFAITGEVPREKVKEKSECVGIMSFAQCPPFWPYLKNKIIDEKTLPLKVYDWSGPTYRNESGGTHGLDRVEEFNRTETLWVGTKEQEIKVWEEVKEAFVNFYDKVLDVEIRVAKVTPWWMAHAGLKTETGTAETGTFDFDAYLPYRGDRDKEWLEIQNVSSNGDKYPQAFNVREKSQDILWSGCAGASFQRVVVAFLAQKGLDSKNWPKNVKEKFNEEIKGLTELKFY